MSVHVHDLKPFKLYNSNSNKLFIPLAENDNKKGSLIYLLSSNIEDSIKLINSNAIINRNWFKSYYIEKSINAIISNEGTIVEVLDSDALLENKLDTKSRNALADNEFGIPSKRKYPLNDEEHVRSAIKMFNYVDKDDEALLAKNIIKRIKKFNIVDIEIGPNNRFGNYYKVVKEDVFNHGDGYTSYYRSSKDIKEQADKCNKFYKSQLTNSYSVSIPELYTRDIKYIGIYHDEDNLIKGFLIAYRNDNVKDGNKLMVAKVFASNSLSDSEKMEVYDNLIYNFRNVYVSIINEYRDIGPKYAKVFSMNENDKLIMDKLALRIGYVLKDSFKLTGTTVKKKGEFIIRLSDIEIQEESNKVISSENLGVRDGNSLIVFDNVFNEDGVGDRKIKQYLYSERLKNQREVLDIYTNIRNRCPVIKNTRLSIDAYKGLNLFIDMSYYNNVFINKNKITGDRGVDLYAKMMTKLLSSIKDAEKYGYSRRTVFIPIYGYSLLNEDIIDYRKNINPISTITRLVKRGDTETLNNIFKEMDVIFFTDQGYFLINDFNNFEYKFITKFVNNINKMVTKSIPANEEDFNKDSKDAIVTDIIDRLETSQNIKLYGITGTTKTVSKVPKSTKENSNNKDMSIVKDEEPKKKDEEIKIDDKKKQIVDAINLVASTSTSTEEAIKKLNNDEYLADIVKDISQEESNGMKVSVTRNARMNELSRNLNKKSINGTTIKDLIEKSEYVGDSTPLPTSSAHINSINNDQWNNLQFINFNKEYNENEDIMNILHFFTTRTVPIGIIDVKVENTSTTEDYVNTWNVYCEDINGTRFGLRFDIPRLKNNRFMRLRGNDKTINAQLMNLPIIKTEKDVCQITTNYNKIFFRIFGKTLGKSNVVTDRIIKALNKYDGNMITYKIGSNKMNSLKYDLPTDYVDFSNDFSFIKYKGVTFYFNQDEIREKYENILDLKKGIPVGYDMNNKSLIYFYDSDTKFYSELLLHYLYEDPKFKELYDNAKPSSKYAYSKASILNVEIPVIVICCYCEGLTKTLNKANIKFEITDKRPTFDKNRYDFIKFKDAYLEYELNYNSSILMNGIKECNTEDYSIKEVDTKSMWTEMLDNFGGRIKADGLDNFYDLMFDPITIRTCEAYDLPYDFVSALIYASDLLIDSKFNKHTDITGNRLRVNELIAGYTYKALSESYASYRTALKKSGKAIMSIKQSAIIDKILTDNTSSDASTINDLCYAEAINTVSWKGLSGLNSERSYSLDKRTYDESMNGVLGMSTGFAGTVGETRQATVNANIQGKRGYIKDTSNGKVEMNDVNTMCISECLTPMCTTHDDPFREAMSYIQRTKHDMRVAGGDPLLITNGMDDALTEFTPDVFSFNAKKNGKIIEKDESHIIIKYVDGTIDFIDLNNKVYKNSDGGFYTSVKLKPVDNLGTTVKEGQLIAYDPLSYTTNIGYDKNATYNQGSIVKIAIITSDKGFEDSCVVDRYVSNALSSNVITQVPVSLPKNTNVYNLVKKGQVIQEGDPLMVIQNAFDDNDVNVLLKNLTDDEEEVTSLGRIPIKSKNTGIIEDIKIYRTVEIEELSSSLQKIVSDYEREQSKVRKTIEKYDKDKAKEYTNDYKLSSTGKLKNIEEGVLIEIYVNYKDDFSVGDKLIILGAQKGVAKEVFEPGSEPRSEYRPDEPIDVVASMVSFDKRMVTAPLQYTLAYKGLVELDRQVKDIMGIKQDYCIQKKDFRP